jgi:hypothetical protein
MSDTPLPDDELVPLETGGSYFAQIVNLADVRIQAGHRRYKAAPACKHMRLTFCTSERRVWCDDCSRTIDNFDAFKTITEHFRKMESEARVKLDKVNDALKHAARLRAVKELDRLWSGRAMAAACPHCKGGLLPEDFANGASAATSREIELARRARLKDQANG